MTCTRNKTLSNKGILSQRLDMGDGNYYLNILFQFKIRLQVIINFYLLKKHQKPETRNSNGKRGRVPYIYGTVPCSVVQVQI